MENISSSQFIAVFFPLIMAGMGLYVSIRPPQKHGWIHWIWFSAFLVLGLIAGIASVYVMKSSSEDQTALLKNQQELATHGLLLPSNDLPEPTACNPQPSTKMGDYLFVTFAGGGLKTLIKTKSAVLTIGEHPTILMERGPSGIMVDVDMLNANGDLMVRIEQNEWRVIPGQISYEERPDPSTLVVYDKSGRETLWIKYLNPSTVKIRGVFYKPGDATPIVISDNSISMNPNLKFYMPYAPNGIGFVPCYINANDKFNGPIFAIR